eukprot:TRINITY_DN1847_c0_g1_i1.p1 TRINITY_DN1847_c0_g1~~TRINITY_DN1847_c0_g1_i1.p1  ORF type:complete len:629 (+),score=141.89 TRINITY_DN1847_c0_g1_i1:32-1888(+)
MAYPLTDVSTASNFTEVVVPHYDLVLKCDFEARTLSGSCTLTVKQLGSATSALVLDTMLLSISTIQTPDGVDVPFNLAPEDKEFPWKGAALTIPNPPAKIVVNYATHPDAPSTCWLNPSQTLGKKLPYLFTQGQAILNRSLFPCQDTPAVKSTYTAHLHVQNKFVALASAACLNTDHQPEESSFPDYVLYRYSMEQPIPVYLVAFAIGDLKGKDVSDRIRVWTEPSLLDAAHAEFNGVLEKYLQTGEKLFGPYLWERYDILIAPPSFPWGGMENARLTVLSPTLIAGDGSLTNVAAHEIGHSWFGNLVTNCNWSNFWLNEGFTMYAERRIVAQVHGQDQANLEASNGWDLLREEIDQFGHDHILTKLSPSLEDVDPDDTYNQCPYEKGFSFLLYLRSEVGSDEAFDGFLRSYVDKFKWQSITPQDFFDFFDLSFPSLSHLRTQSGKSFDEWLETTGYPLAQPSFPANPLIESVQHVVKHWETSPGQPLNDLPAHYTAPSNWNTFQTCSFLDHFTNSDTVSHEVIAAMNEEFNLSSSKNVEILLRYSKLTIKHGYTENYSNIRAFLHTTGKQKLLLPIYRNFVAAGPEGIAYAKEIFDETKPKLHNLVTAMVEKILATE